MYVCLFACMLGREVYKEKKKKKKQDILLLSGRCFCREVPKKTKKQKQYFTVREMLPNKVVIAICCNTHTHTGDMHARK